MAIAEQQGVEQEFSNRYGFRFDDFQVQAMEHIRSDRSVMLAAPTSAGKTVVAEYALWRAVTAGRKAIYTSPIKALSNQKRRELERFFPDNVGLLTGDRSENPEADVVVMTTEVLRNMLLEDSERLYGVDSIVFDEVHYLADRDRGTIWEEAIITCLRHIQLVCLSATIANAEEIAAWISQTHRPIALVRHDERPVPLAHYTFAGSALRLIRDGSGDRTAKMPAHHGKRDRKTPSTNPALVIQALRKASLLPAIWFAFHATRMEIAPLSFPRRARETPGPRRQAIENAIAWFWPIGVARRPFALPDLTSDGRAAARSGLSSRRPSCHLAKNWWKIYLFADTYRLCAPPTRSRWHQHARQNPSSSAACQRPVAASPDCQST